ncbi:MAG: esterase/lipase family protein [Betaproteobacteria bacterium]
MSLAAVVRWSLLGQLLLGALIAYGLMPAHWPAWMALPLGVLLPVIGTVLVLAIELLVGALADPRRPRTSFAHVLRVWLGESIVSLRAFGWRQPFAAGFAEPPRLHDPRRPAVLLIAGYVCNRAAWTGLLRSGLLSKYNVATVNLRPVFGSIDLYAEEIHAAVEALRAETGAQRVILVGHSMGGLAARAYLRRHGSEAVVRVITLATPHHGTIFGALGHGANAREMRKDCKYLTTLAGAETAALRRRFVCIATLDDNLVVPRTSPLMPDAEHHLLDGVGHLALIEDPRAWRLIVQAIEATRPDDIEAARAA